MLCIKKWVLSQQYAVTLPGTAPIQANASLSDRVACQKAVVTVFLYENTLSFSFATKLVELAKNLSNDKVALLKLEMSRTTAKHISIHTVLKVHEE